MRLSTIFAFLKDEDASVTMEYLVLVSFMSLIWIAGGNEYKTQLVAAYTELSRDLSRIKTLIPLH